MLKRNTDGSWECSGPAWPDFQLQVPELHRAHESHEAGTVGVRGSHSWVMCPRQWLVLIKCLQIPQSQVACSFYPELTPSPWLSSFSSPNLSEACRLPPHRSCIPELRSQTTYSPQGTSLVAWPAWSSPHLLPLLHPRQLSPVTVAVCPLAFTLTDGSAQGLPRPAWQGHRHTPSSICPQYCCGD